MGTWEWVINKMVYLPISFSYYLHHTYDNYEKANYYERVGFRVRLADHCNLGLSIKAHQGAADLLEFVVGYTLHRDPNNYRLK